MAAIVILVASMTGTAEMVAEEIRDILGPESIDIRMMDEVSSADFDHLRQVLVVSSTYGEGDVPDPAKTLFEELSFGRPNLAHMAYGVISLGDRRYKDTFARGGKRWNALLLELGAYLVGDLLTIDASAEQPDLRDWSLAWAKRLNAAACDA